MCMIIPLCLKSMSRSRFKCLRRQDCRSVYSDPPEGTRVSYTTLLVFFLSTSFNIRHNKSRFIILDIYFYFYIFLNKRYTLLNSGQARFVEVGNWSQQQQSQLFSSFITHSSSLNIYQVKHHHHIHHPQVSWVLFHSSDEPSLTQSLNFTISACYPKRTLLIIRSDPDSKHYTKLIVKKYSPWAKH